MPLVMHSNLLSFDLVNCGFYIFSFCFLCPPVCPSVLLEVINSQLSLSSRSSLTCDVVGSILSCSIDMLGLY